MPLAKGLFLFTLDTELAWGTGGNPKYQEDYERTRQVVVRLLDLLSKYRISATWAVVGHLHAETCDGSNHRHPGDVRDPLWYAPDIVEQIRRCSVPQEIGSHSFSHVVSEETCDEEIFKEELRAHQTLAGGILKSFVYPKNRVRFTHLLAQYGFTVYRSEDNVWYQKFPRLLRKVAHGIDNYLVPSAPVGDVTRHDGVTAVPGSYFYVHKRGWARLLPVSFRVRKAKAGLRKAAQKRQIFHLWTHPFNIASDPDNLLRGIEEVLAAARTMIDEEVLLNRTMSQLANYRD